MIDKEILDAVLPLPTLDELKEQKVEELKDEGFVISNFHSGGVFYTMLMIVLRIKVEVIELLRVVLNNMFVSHAGGAWLDLKMADYSKKRKKAQKTQGFITVRRADMTGEAVKIPKGHVFKSILDINGEELRYSAYVTYLTQYQQLLSGAYDETDETQAAYIEDLALTTAIQDMLIEQDMHAKGCYDFDEETENWIQAQGQTAYETALTNVGETLRAELGYSDEEDMSSFALSYAKALGVTVEDYIAVYRKQRAMVNYYTVLLGDNPVTEDAIQSAYETNVAASKERFEGDAAAFETALYSGKEVWYKPEGYRSILQILLPAEGDTDEARLESVQATVDAIDEQLNAGESFQTLMAEYNTDTAFDDADFLTVGYQVHRDSVVWDEKFVAAAFSERMAQPGCWSDPIVSDAGVHILYYLCDSKSGAIEMTDAIHDALSYTLYQDMCSEALSARLNELSDSAKVVLY